MKLPINPSCLFQSTQTPLRALQPRESASRSRNPPASFNQRRRPKALQPIILARPGRGWTRFNQRSASRPLQRANPFAQFITYVWFQSTQCFLGTATPGYQPIPATGSCFNQRSASRALQPHSVFDAVDHHHVSINAAPRGHCNRGKQEYRLGPAAFQSTQCFLGTATSTRAASLLHIIVRFNQRSVFQALQQIADRDAVLAVRHVSINAVFFRHCNWSGYRQSHNDRSGFNQRSVF
jgi:hypothetical protein